MVPPNPLYSSVDAGVIIGVWFVTYPTGEILQIGTLSRSQWKASKEVIRGWISLISEATLKSQK